MVNRNFRFVNFGESAPTDAVTISCDGRVRGATLELTHWDGNTTPDQYYADTSTEMALKFASSFSSREFDNALILNNHFDTDGLCSVWSTLNPEQALQYKDLLRQGAEAGDFGEWSSDEGVKLDLAILALGAGDEKQAYERVLKEMPKLLLDITTTGGKSYEKLWKSGLQEAMDGWNDLKQGRAKLYRGPSPNMVVLEEAGTSVTLSPYALYRGLKENKLWDGTTRILRVQLAVENSSFAYNYEKIGHGWVSKLVSRPVVPSADGNVLAAKLNEQCGTNVWKSGGSAGLVSICCTRQPFSVGPREVARLLAELDPSCS